MICCLSIIFSDSNPYSGVELRPWTFQWDLTLYLLIWTVSHMNRSLHQCFWQKSRKCICSCFSAIDPSYIIWFFYVHWMGHSMPLRNFSLVLICKVMVICFESLVKLELIVVSTEKIKDHGHYGSISTHVQVQWNLADGCGKSILWSTIFGSKTLEL